MAIEEVKISFHRIRKCGFYGWGAAEAAFGNVEEALAELAGWSRGTPLHLTKLVDPTEDDLPIYLLDIRQEGQDWLLATWNEVPAEEGGVASVPRGSIVGRAEVHLNPIRADDIPGYATYFWFVPQHQVVASIRFRHNITGHEGMRRYVERFLALESSHAVEGVSEDTGEVKIIGYSDRPDEPLVRVHPMFRTSAYTKPGHTRFILENHARIKKVIRRGHLSTLNPVEQAMWPSIVRAVRGQPAPNPVAINKRLYIELEYTPSRAELEAMIEGEADDHGNFPWDDMGFVFQGDKTKHWISKSYASDNFDLDVERDGTGSTVTLASLAQAIRGGRRSILELLRQND